ncbi:MAG: hypothetical protein KIC94_12295 [Clostridiales bacterium]|nr:hypothetical protein [Clostridiales bacterium]
MSYEDFKKRIYQELSNNVQADVTLEHKTVRKNNGVVLDTIVLHSKAEQLSSCLYLNHYYEKYKHGTTEVEIIEEMLNVANESKGEVEQQLLITSEITDFSKLSDFICYKLVNAKMNEELVKTVPHKKFLDLAIIYYVICNIERDGIGTILIQNSFFEEWDCSLEELHEKAVENTMRILPAQVRSMEEVIIEMMGRDEEVLESSGVSPNMYVVSNRKNLQGAGVILYPNLLRDFFHGLKETARGLIILPSSVHEQIIIPYTEHMEVDSLRKMVKEINSTQVAREEVLSENIYVYSDKDDTIFLADGQEL